MECHTWAATTSGSSTPVRTNDLGVSNIAGNAIGVKIDASSEIGFDRFNLRTAQLLKRTPGPPPW
jgi:hypothetical protein